MGVSEDREWLRKERERLYEQDAALQDEYRRLTGSTDKAKHDEFGVQIRRHRRELDAYHDALNEFHRRYGAVDV